MGRVQTPVGNGNRCCNTLLAGAQHTRSLTPAQPNCHPPFVRVAPHVHHGLWQVVHIDLEPRGVRRVLCVSAHTVPRRQKHALSSAAAAQQSSQSETATPDMRTKATVALGCMCTHHQPRTPCYASSPAPTSRAGSGRSRPCMRRGRCSPVGSVPPPPSHRPCRCKRQRSRTAAGGPRPRRSSCPARCSCRRGRQPRGAAWQCVRTFE